MATRTYRLACRERVACAVVPGIGVMREGPLHAAVKALLAEPGDRLEVPVGRFVIDLVRADGELVEVQTGDFGPLGKKLDALLDEHRIRVVHPVAAERRIVRVDEHGQVLGARRSPKRATAVEVFDKLVAFPSLLTHPNLTIEVLLLREDHIRRPQPTTARRRTRDPGERRLVEVLDRVELRTPEDILAALPALPRRAVQHTRVRRPPALQHAAGAAHAVLPADDRDRRAGGQARPCPAARPPGRPGSYCGSSGMRRPRTTSVVGVRTVPSGLKVMPSSRWSAEVTASSSSSPSTTRTDASSSSGIWRRRR